VRTCPDETVCAERFGLCIRKTDYRSEQEDRVSNASEWETRVGHAEASVSVTSRDSHLTKSLSGFSVSPQTDDF